MRRLAPLLVLLCAVGAHAEEPTGVVCGLYAFVEPEDAGSRAVYDGLRKGLELAHLPRVCMEALHESETLMQEFVGRVRKDRALPLFAIGDGPWAQVKDLNVPRVVVVERYSVKGKPVEPLPTEAGVAVVYADLPAARIKAALTDLAADVVARDEWRADEWGGLILHLRWGRRDPGTYAKAVKRARDRKTALVSDDRGRFGRGAIVTLVPRHDLVGRAAAEAARQLRANPKAKLKPRAITGFEIWVDLEAADEQGIELPLAFLAKADKLRRGKPKR